MLDRRADDADAGVSGFERPRARAHREAPTPRRRWADRRERVHAPPPPKAHASGARRRPPGWLSCFREGCRKAARRRALSRTRAAADPRVLILGNDPARTRGTA